MTEAQIAATQIPVNDLIELLAAVGNRNYLRFQELETAFVSQHAEEVWQEVFNFRVLPVLDKSTSQWLLVQWSSDGINNIKTVN